MPLNNLLGFGDTDYLEIVLALLLLCFIFLRPIIAPAAVWLAQRTALCMLTLFLLPIVLRLPLLPNHPVPTPDVFDEFGHLFVAATLGHGRLANPVHPMHRFFETIFILQEPSYSSIYPLGQGIMLALGQLIFRLPWAGVVAATGALCALVYWMLRAWVTAEWALAGGLLAVIEFGPLNGWMNCYWGGALAACSGCLVFGALPRIVQSPNWRAGAILGTGLALHLLTRPYESVLIILSAVLYLVWARSLPVRPLAIAAGFALAAGVLMLAQNRTVTGNWFQMPYQLSQYQYGVPMALTFQPEPVPHRTLTPQQQLEYESQRSFRSGQETLATYLMRLEYRIRYYRFFFLPPLYVTLIAYLFTVRSRYWWWVVATGLIFALGSDFYSMFQVHYIAAITCLLLLTAVEGLRSMGQWRIGRPVMMLILFFCAAHFLFWYTLHLFETNDASLAMRQYETWNSINHAGSSPRIVVNRQLAGTPGQLLVFVHYSPQHIFQQEWVYNEADINAARIVWARDLGPLENEDLIHYYPRRTVWLLDPDVQPPRLSRYSSEPPAQTKTTAPSTPAPPAEQKSTNKPTQPSLRFERVK